MAGISRVPTIAHEIKKTRPCFIISPDEMDVTLQTVTITPMTTKSYDYLTRVGGKFQNKKGLLILDQIRTAGKKRLTKRLAR